MTVFGDPLWAESLSLANIFFGLLIGMYNARQVRQCNPKMCWLYLITGLLGFYWAGLYVFVFFTRSGTYDAVLFGQVYVRPAFTFTLATMASLALSRWRGNR